MLFKRIKSVLRVFRSLMLLTMRLIWLAISSNSSPVWISITWPLSPWRMIPHLIGQHADRPGILFRHELESLKVMINQITPRNTMVRIPMVR